MIGLPNGNKHSISMKRNNRMIPIVVRENCLYSVNHVLNFLKIFIDLLCIQYSVCVYA